MAAPGPKPQSNKQKRAKGETRPSRVADNVLEFPPVDRVPDPPEWLNEYGCELWGDIAPALFKQRVLTHADLFALSHLCQLHGEIVDGYSRRLSPTASELAQLRLLFAEFGMTPSSRNRVSSVGEGNKENPFSKNGKGKNGK